MFMEHRHLTEAALLAHSSDLNELFEELSGINKPQRSDQSSAATYSDPAEPEA